MSEPMTEADYILDMLKERAPDLADWLERKLAWIAGVAPAVRACVLAGEDLQAGDPVGFGDDDLIYRCTEGGVPYWGTVDEDTEKYRHVYVQTDTLDLGPGRITINGEEVEATRRSITFAPAISSGDFLTMDLSPETHDERMARLIREGRVGPR